MASLRVKEILCLLYSALLFISGVLLIGFSVVLSYKLFYHFKFVPSSSIGPFIVIFLLGFVHLFLTWLGVKGPTREHDFHIILFMVFTLILLVVECAVGVWAVILWDEVDVESVQIMTDSFDELIKQDFYKKDWARLESKLQCCGLNGVQEYKDHKNVIPLSCCDSDVGNSTCSRVFEVGCKKPLARYVKRLLIDAAIMGFCCCLFQAVGVFAFYTFFKGLKKERQDRITRRLAMQRRISQENTPGSANAGPVPVAAAPPPQPQTPPASAP